MRSEFKNKWFKHALLNMLILSLIFGALVLTIYGAQYGTTILSMKNSAEQYAEKLSKLLPEDIVNIASGSGGEQYAQVIQPEYIVAVYNIRPDGSAEFITTNVWLNQISPSTSPQAKYTAREKIGQTDFIVSQNSIVNDVGGVRMYVKVFYSMQNLRNAQRMMIVNYVLSAVVVLLVSLGVSIMLAWIGEKPLIESYEKQKVFINDISHELRTPITIIKGNLENLIAENIETNTEVREELYTALHEVEYMSEMTTGMLTIVRNSKQTKSKQQEGALSDIVFGVVDVYADMASMQGRSLVAMVDSCPLKMSKDKIKQLLTILLDNALKYTEEGDKIQLSLKVVKNKIKLIVSDTGIGVPEEELTKLFDRFYRASNVEEKEGTGLGLSIAKSIVESFNGEIYATPNLPKGLTITAEFDYAKVNQG